jgi:type IV secretion system protein TrbL
MGLCDLPGLKDSPPCKVAGAVSAAVDFAKDPLGYIAQKMQAAAAGLASTVLPQLERLTHPDLSAGWFLDAYRVSFALAIFIFVAFLGWNFVQLARRRVSGDDVVETLGFYTPLFFGGVILGPALGSLLLELTGALTDTLIQWGIGGSVTGTTTALQASIAAGDPARITGGAIVAIVFFFCLIVALVLCFVVLLVMLVTLYLTGAIIPLSLVWLVHPRQRAKGLKVVMVWVGICFSHVLLFLLLGVAFRMVAGLSTDFDQPGLKILANLAVAVIALLAATLSPLGLLVFAPVGPSSAAGGGPSLSIPRPRTGGGYPDSAEDSQTAQLARGTGSAAGEDDPGGNLVGVGPDAGGTAPGGGATGGGLLGLLAASRGDGGGDGGGDSSASMEPGAAVGSPAAGSAASHGAADRSAAGGGAAAPVGTDSPARGAAAAWGRSPAAGAASSGAALAGAAAVGVGAGTAAHSAGGASAANGTAAMAAGSASAKQAGDSLTSAGGAVATTGAGAPVGAGLAAAGQGVKAAGSVLGATAELARSAGQMAAEHMEHAETPDLGPQQNQGGGGADPRAGR